MIGEMYECEERRQPMPWLRSRSMEDVFEHHLEPLGMPIVFNLPLGHGKHLCTIPLGVDRDGRRRRAHARTVSARASRPRSAGDGELADQSQGGRSRPDDQRKSSLPNVDDGRVDGRVLDEQ